MSDIIIYGVSGGILKQYIEKIERLEQEKSDLISEIKSAYTEAKSDDLEPKVMK